MVGFKYSQNLWDVYHCLCLEYKLDILLLFFLVNICGSPYVFSEYMRCLVIESVTMFYTCRVIVLTEQIIVFCDLE